MSLFTKKFMRRSFTAFPSTTDVIKFVEELAGKNEIDDKMVFHDRYGDLEKFNPPVTISGLFDYQITRVISDDDDNTDKDDNNQDVEEDSAFDIDSDREESNSSKNNNDDNKESDRE